jgi:hypothetical protein
MKNAKRALFPLSPPAFAEAKPCRGVPLVRERFGFAQAGVGEHTRLFAMRYRSAA